MYYLGEVLVRVGVIGVVQFVALAFCGRQLSATTAPSVQHRLSSPVVRSLIRHADLLAVVSALALVAGIVVQR